jgi:uncharacterized protein (DUF885 family)
LCSVYILTSRMTILDDYFGELLQIYPSLATRLGVEDSDDSYEDVISEDFNKQFKKLTKKYNDRVKKSKNKTIDHVIVKWIINMYSRRHKDYLTFIPMTSYLSGVTDFTFMNQTNYTIKTNKDTLHLIQRHKIFTKRIQTYIVNMKCGIKRNITLPKIICKDLIHLLENYCNTKQYLIDINTKNKDSYVEYMNNEYAKDIKHLTHFLRNTYYPKCRNTIGLCALPDGKSIYNYFIRYHLTFKMSPVKIHQIGLSEVDRIVKKIHKLKEELGYSNSLTLQEFNNRMIKDPQNYYNDSNEVMYAFKNMQDYINRKVMTNNFFANVEDYEIHTVPTYMEKTAALAFYVSGTVFNDSRKGMVYINTRNLHEIPKYEVMALSAHEGKPGHHYQFRYMKETNVSESRQCVVNNTTFVEGWALYAESLLDYSDKPYYYFGKLTLELFRATRLVVDTGIHYYNWTYDQAVEYMSKYVAMDRSAIEIEVKRYICIPAQALCYKIGELEILKLRDKFFKRFKKFSQTSKENENLLIKSFHELLLSDGILPMELIKDKFSKIIKNGTF